MSRSPEYDSHTLFSQRDADAPFEVSVLQKAVCRECGRAGDKLYHRYCRDEAERPGPPQKLRLTPDVSPLKIAADVNSIFNRYRAEGLLDEDIAELIAQTVRQQTGNDDYG